MKNTINTTPAAVYAEFLTAVEAYEVGGPAAQVKWIQGRNAAAKARKLAAMQATALMLGAALTLCTAVFITFVY